MKNLNKFLLAAIAAGTVQTAGAMNYSPTDLLLVFRGAGYNDVVLDLGPVSSYIGLAPGTVVPVTYDQTLVSSNFLGSMVGASFSLVAANPTYDQSATSRAWVTDAQQLTPALNVTGSKLSQIKSRIDGVGGQATAATGTNALPFVVSPSSTASYSYQVSGGTGANISTFQGLSAFPIDLANPTTLAFYELKAAAGTSATLIGAFTIDIDGTLTFTAGQLPPLVPSAVTQMTRVSGLNTIYFDTAKGNNYQLQYSTSLPGTWFNVTGATAFGDNTVNNLTDYSTDPARYYRIQTTY